VSIIICIYHISKSLNMLEGKKIRGVGKQLMVRCTRYNIM
jgi:hypothetical protein